MIERANQGIFDQEKQKLVENKRKAVKGKIRTRYGLRIDEKASRGK